MTQEKTALVRAYEAMLNMYGSETIEARDKIIVWERIKNEPLRLPL